MKSELQAVILAAGKGSRMTELTDKMPKCLLPIANKPMIHYPLTMLIEADFTDVIIIIPDIYENEIKTQLTNAGYDIRIEFVTIPYNKEPGTAESLKSINKKLTSDVLVLSCDFISNYSLRNFINFYRINDPSLLVLIGNQSSVPTVGLVPGRKDKFKTEKDIIGIDSQNLDRIVFLNSAVDFEEFIDFKLSMIKLCPNIDLFTQYLDCHVYILKKYLIDYLINEKNINSIKSELVPSLIRSQFKRLTNNEQNIMDTSFNLNKDGDLKKNVNSFVRVDEIRKELDKFNPLIDNDSKKDNSLSQLKYPNTLINCSSVIIDNQKYFIARSNNILSYFELNKLSKQLQPNHQNLDFGRAQIKSDCIIGKNNKINEKTSIKKTVIGNNCTINEKTQLDNCLIMDNVIIDEFCIIKNSIIGNNVKIGRNCNLKDCIVAAEKQVNPSSTLINESIVHKDQMIEF